MPHTEPRYGWKVVGTYKDVPRRGNTLGIPSRVCIIRAVILRTRGTAIMVHHIPAA